MQNKNQIQTTEEPQIEVFETLTNDYLPAIDISSKKQVEVSDILSFYRSMCFGVVHCN